MMPRQVMLAMVIEGVLMTSTALLLVQPYMIFRSTSNRLKALASFGGSFFLCITFCWSFLLGCIIALNEISSRV